MNLSLEIAVQEYNPHLSILSNFLNVQDDVGDSVQGQHLYACFGRLVVTGNTLTGDPQKISQLISILEPQAVDGSKEVGMWLD